ncbi:cytosolic beta-glucosidase-like isoform X2 [Xenia sp. Carnegie-2017]|uniref:cytosolic beta-glucosidase-like isoform X2 n=1 Tax=Xenia sp. Carnegie-2017 TaxID=2897299 RepID=UPI001F033E94|nr:cytosolic beta-glucosidase-like isoform X2 [Xenia sp. Carnegie-2017]
MMALLKNLSFVAHLLFCFLSSNKAELHKGVFPDDFAWGCASSAYQIEGAWNLDGKGPSIWDTYTHEGGHVYANQSGDVACDSYHNYKKDVKMLKMLGVTHYRFSISWSRILPSGTADIVNEKGIEYYNKLIDELVKNGIQPMVTLYHWDLPQALENKGGWLNKKTSDIFSDYARLCFKTYGDRVKLWATLNEPWVAAVFGYGTGFHAPGIHGIKKRVYDAAHTMLLAHGKTWHVYDKEFRQSQKGKISIVLNADWYFPKKEEPIHLNACERARQFFLGWFAHPIFVNGDYPEMMKTLIAKHSRLEGLPMRLPLFTQEEKKMLKKTGDFFGLNHYTSTVAGNLHIKNASAVDWNYWNDGEFYTYKNKSWPRGAPTWLYMVPQGFRNLLTYIKNEYGNPEIYVTENGWSEIGEDVRFGKPKLKDNQRATFYIKYISEALKSYQIDGVNLKGYFAWSLMDDFEWNVGYHERFGLHWVNFSDPERKRVPKFSTKVYAKIVADNGFPAEASTDIHILVRATEIRNESFSVHVTSIVSMALFMPMLCTIFMS